MQDHIAIVILIKLGLVDPSLLTVSDSHKFTDKIVVVNRLLLLPATAAAVAVAAVVWGESSL